MGKDFQKQVRKIIEERGYTLRKELSPLFDGTDKTGKVNAEIWPTWEKYPAVKVANVVVELRKIIPIHEECMDWTGYGEEYAPPDPIMGMLYDEVTKTIKHLSLLLSDFSEDNKKNNAALQHDLTLGLTGFEAKSKILMLSACYGIKELLPELEKTKAVFNVAGIGRQCRLPYHKGEDRIYITMRNEAGLRIDDLQEAIIGRSLFEVAAAIATIFVHPQAGCEDVSPGVLKIKAHRRTSKH